MLGINSKLQLKLDIIAKVDKGKISIINASKLLKKSRRTIERYLKDYRKNGIAFIFHKNKNRIPVNKISDDVKKNVQKLIRIFHFNLPYFFQNKHLCHSNLVFVHAVRLKKTRDFTSFLLSGFNFLQTNSCPFTININNFKQLGLFQGRRGQMLFFGVFNRERQKAVKIFELNPPKVGEGLDGPKTQKSKQQDVLTILSLSENNILSRF